MDTDKRELVKRIISMAINEDKIKKWSVKYKTSRQQRVDLYISKRHNPCYQ